jgi:hypothetical protein
MKNNSIFVIVAIVSSMITAISFVPLSFADISSTGTSHAQQPGKGVCNADEKIHEHTGIGSSADAGFHHGVDKNFGDPLTGFVGPTSTCKNPLP